MTLKLQALLTVAALSTTTAMIANVTPASAAALTWNLNATFDDGGTAVGTFDYDATNGVLSQFNLAVTPGTITGSVFPDFTYTPPSSTGSLFNDVGLQLGNSAGRNFFALFSSPLTNAGGSLSLIPGFSREEVPFVGGINLSRNVQSGFVSASATAIPTPALLPGLIGLGVGILRKRRTA